MVGALTGVKIRADTHHVCAGAPESLLIQLVDTGRYCSLVALRPCVEGKVAVDVVRHILDAFIAETGPVGDEVDVPWDLATDSFPFVGECNPLERRYQGLPVHLELSRLVLEVVDERRHAVDRPVARGTKVEGQKEGEVANLFG